MLEYHSFKGVVVMNKKEAFLKFIRNYNVTTEEYNLAKAYYLEDACEEEVKLYDSFLKILVPALQKAYNKSERHLMALSRKYGMSKEEALALIQNFSNTNSNVFLLELKNQGVNIEEYLKALYLACHKYNFYKSKLVDFISSLGINYKLFLGLVKIYLKKYLKLSEEDVVIFLNRLETKEDFYNFLSSRLEYNFKNVLYYFRNFATVEERVDFRNIVDEIISGFYQEDLNIEDIAQKIESKYCIPLDRAKKMVSEYRKRKENNSKKEKLNKYKIVCEMFFNDFSYEEIQEYINNSNISWKYLKGTYLDNYVKTFTSKEERQIVYTKILLRMEEYLIFKRNAKKDLRDKLKNEPFDELIFMEAKKIITMLVYGDKNESNFIKKLGEETFYRYITIVEMYDPSLYNLYLIKKYRKDVDVDNNVVETIMNYINNGILENGVLREFNILDYFRIVRLPIDIFITILQGYDNKVKQVIVSFLFKNKSRLRPLTNVITSNVDPIEDSIVKKYMILNDLPMFDLVYMLVLENYRNGNLIIDLNSRK